MGSMTRGQMKNQVLAVTKATDRSHLLDVTLQWAYDEVAGAYPWRVLELLDTSTVTLAEGTETYTLPTTVRGVGTVRYADGSSSRMLRYREIDKFAELHPELDSSTVTGPPQEYSIRGYSRAVTIMGVTTIYTGLQLDVWPTPSADEEGKNLVLAGVQWTNAFATDSDVTFLDRSTDQAIVYYAIAYEFEQLSNLQAAGYWRQAAGEAVQRAIMAEERVNQIYLDPLQEAVR